MGADYQSYVKFIAIRAPTFFLYIISVLASVQRQYIAQCISSTQPLWEEIYQTIFVS